MDLPPLNPDEWAAPSWEPPPAPGSTVLRQTFPLAVFASAAWLAFAAHQWFAVLMMRRRTAAVRVVVESGADNLNVSLMRLADDQLQRAFMLGWFVAGAVFVVGACWAYAAAVNGSRLGVPDVRPGKIALQFAIPILGIGYSIRQLMRILETLGRSNRPLATWLNTMFAYLFVWIGSYLLERQSFSGVRTDQGTLESLELQGVLSVVGAAMITLIAALAVRAILHTDRELRTGTTLPQPGPQPSIV